MINETAQRKFIAEHGADQPTSNPCAMNLLASPHALSLHFIRGIVPREESAEDAEVGVSSVADCVHSFFERSVRTGEGVEHLLGLERTARDVVVRSVRILNGKAIGLFLATVDPGMTLSIVS